MQWHPLEHRSAGYLGSSWSLFPAHLVETSGLRAGWDCSDDCEERYSDRYADGAGNLCGSGISLWQSAPRGWGGIFSDWIAANGPGFLDITKRRTPSGPGSREISCARRKLTDRRPPRRHYFLAAIPSASFP